MVSRLPMAWRQGDGGTRVLRPASRAGTELDRRRRPQRPGAAPAAGRPRMGPAPAGTAIALRASVLACVRNAAMFRGGGLGRAGAGQIRGRLPSWRATNLLDEVLPRWARCSPASPGRRTHARAARPRARACTNRHRSADPGAAQANEAARQVAFDPRCAHPVVRFSTIENSSYMPIAIAPTTTSPAKARPICIDEPAEMSR
jgi:hypothetical protein